LIYKIVKNASGDVVAFGPDDENYDPSLKKGETMTIESGKIAEDMIKAYQAKLANDTKTVSAAKVALLERLGITEEEAKLLLS
jgi:hypothetical protein